MLSKVARPHSATLLPAARTVMVGRQAIRYADHGAGSAGRVLLLLNGIGADLETSAAFARAFQNTRVIAFDVPGVGASPAPLLPYRMRDVADLAAALLDQLGLDRVDVFGVSWGGTAAQEFALRHPARCRTMTLAATSAGCVVLPGGPGQLLQIGAKLLGGKLRLDRDLIPLQAMLASRPNLRGYLYQLFALCGWMSWFRLPRVQLPVLVLMGSDDPIVAPVNGRIIVSRLPRATMETLDCGHLFMLTRPVEIARRVERFMMAHESPA
ncbi:alpha/beta fold hydrolase [Variovorax sp. dw_954]|uniref:alpha/beta fold hydrolase n=1 Tax=Variovorax sp. dw_954 TaxID=2720078 RepID=UPI001BD2C554